MPNQTLFDVNAIFDAFDKNGDGVLDRDEYAAYQQYVSQQQHQQRHHQQAKTAKTV